MNRIADTMKNTALTTQRLTPFIVLALIVVLLGQSSMTAYASERTIYISGSVYEFNGDSHYEYSAASANAGANSLSRFWISGNAAAEGKTNGIPSYTVSKEELSFWFSFDQTILSAAEDEWHLVDDKTKKVDDLTLDSNILRGAMILQSSLDRQNWTNEGIQENIFSGDADFSNAIYTTKSLSVNSQR